MNTLEGNKLIAEFMGLGKRNHYESRIVRDVLSLDTPLHAQYLSDTSLIFNTSWEWLMPVVSKIRLMYNYLEVGGTKYVEDLISVIAQGCVEVHILQVYEGIVEFIQWYNKNK